MKRLLIAALAAAAALAFASPATAVPPKREFQVWVDVGGHRLFVHCIGQGSPTVILEAGLGGTSATWAQVQPQAARSTRVCSYDRANLGRSDPGSKPRTSQTAVNEMRTLLRKLRGAGVPAPYVLVGHSFGGFDVQLFARQDGGLAVRGAVFFDASPIDWPDLLDRFGIPTPGPEQNPEGVDIRASSQEVQAAPPFPDIPLIVLTHSVAPPGAPAELEQAWQERQVAHSQLSPQGELVVAEGAGHFIQRDRPDLVIRAIRRVVRRVDRCGARTRGCQVQQSAKVRRRGRLRSQS